MPFVSCSTGKLVRVEHMTNSRPDNNTHVDYNYTMQLEHHETAERHTINTGTHVF